MYVDVCMYVGVCVTYLYPYLCMYAPKFCVQSLANLGWGFVRVCVGMDLCIYLSFYVSIYPDVCLYVCK